MQFVLYFGSFIVFHARSLAVDATSISRNIISCVRMIGNKIKAGNALKSTQQHKYYNIFCVLLLTAEVLD